MIQLAPLGDSAVLITLGTTINRDVSRRVLALAAALRNERLRGVTDVVPAYISLAVHYDPVVVEESELTARLRELVSAPLAAPERAEQRLVVIPVTYDGPDLPSVANARGITVADVVARHSSVEYFVYLLGFTPGFAYLGDLDPALHMPRRESPRSRVSAGAVAIAGSQTAVYPHDTPGGWHLIGTTAVAMFDPAREQPSLLRAGDRVKFEVVA